MVLSKMRVPGESSKSSMFIVHDLFMSISRINLNVQGILSNGKYKYRIYYSITNACTGFLWLLFFGNNYLYHDYHENFFPEVRIVSATRRCFEKNGQWRFVFCIIHDPCNVFNNRPPDV